MTEAINLVGGRLCLDFCNTMRGDARSAENDFWTSYGDLADWCVHTEVLGADDAVQLKQAAATDPRAAERALRAARRLREAMYRAFSAEAAGRGADEADLDLINEVLVRGNSRRKLRPAMQGACWVWDDAASDLEAVLWPVAWSAGELLTSSQLERVKQCGGCPWLFLDASRNHSRRWCDMRDCGNRNKVRKFRERGSP
jgi:predicted RNA-binding Zn ribbon-like protein